MSRLPADANRPLAGIVVLDFGRVYQGPYATLRPDRDLLSGGCRER
jgi:crotonobetainyl-CoA:carnitine CoA-transferase CaiB-like acyl-CoA transferase